MSRNIELTLPAEHALVASIPAAARHLRMSPDTLRGLDAKGIIAKDANGKWDTAEICRRIEAYDEQKRARETRPPSAKSSEAGERLKGLKADHQEMVNAALRGRLIETAAVHASLAEMSTAVTAEFRKLTSRLPVECANQAPETLKKWAEEYAKDACNLIEKQWQELKLVAPDPATKEKRKPGRPRKETRGKK